jgi:signal recognition particle subunit SRP54
VAVSDVNQLVERFFEARKMMQQMAGRFGFPGTGPGRRSSKGRKGKKGKGRGPTPPKVRGGLPGGLPGLSGGLPGGMPDLSDLTQLPAGFDPSKLRFPKK